MKKIGLWLWLLTKRQLKSVAFWVILGIIPLMSLIIPRIEAFGEAPDNQAALYASDADKVALDTIEELVNGESVYTFYVCASKEELLEEVKNGNAQCGYIFDNEITKKIKSKEYKDLITIVKKENTLIADAINESFFAAYFKHFTEVILLDYVESNEKFAEMDSEGLVQLEGAYEAYLCGDDTARFDFEYITGESGLNQTTVIEVEASVFPLRSIMAILIMTGGMLGVITWLTDKEKGIFVPMSREFVKISKMLYVMIPAFLLGVSTIISLIACNEAQTILREVMVMILYVALIAVIGAICCIYIKKSYTMLSIMPILIISSILICPVFIDLAVYIPIIKIIRNFFVPYYYIRLF